MWIDLCITERADLLLGTTWIGYLPGVEAGKVGVLESAVIATP
jgi:hypothetical protein